MSDLKYLVSMCHAKWDYLKKLLKVKDDTKFCQNHNENNHRSPARYILINLSSIRRGLQKSESNKLYLTRLAVLICLLAQAHLCCNPIIGSAILLSASTNILVTSLFCSLWTIRIFLALSFWKSKRKCASLSFHFWK